jgi:hypothetical protein
MSCTSVAEWYFFDIWTATGAGRQHVEGAGAAVLGLGVLPPGPDLRLSSVSSPMFNGKLAQSREVICFLPHRNRFFSHRNLIESIC